jgi:hypothetical protein
MQNRFLSLGLFLLFCLPSIAFSQSSGFPSPNETPWSNKVKGFVTTHVGICYIPVADVSLDHSGSETFYHSVEDLKTNVPGVVAGIGFIPIFNGNGVAFEISYAINGAQYNADLFHEGETFSTKTTFGFTLLDLHVGYIRYFLDGPWHIYTEAFSGIQLVSNTARTTVDGDDSSRQKQFTNFDVTGGFGVFREVAAGGIGGELRVDYTFLESRVGTKDTFGDSKADLFHPVTIKLMAVFFLGRL